MSYKWCKMTTKQKVLSLARFLRKHAPTPIPVKIHFTSPNIEKRLSDCCGMASIGPQYGHIYLDHDRELNTQLDTLVHEWAHIRTGWKIKEHTKEFWIDHGRVYDVYLKWHP